MNLDDESRRSQLDGADMLGLIDRLPEDLEAAWGRAGSLPLPRGASPRHVVLAGMGGSAIGADLAVAFARHSSRASLTVWRDYGLPGWVGKEDLVVVSSHSGNTEESLTAFEAAGKLGADRLAFTTGGTLGKQAELAGVPVWPVEHPGPPRAAVASSFAYTLRMLERLGLASDFSQDVASALKAMRSQRERLTAAHPVTRNPAKRMAGQLMDRWPLFFGAGVLAPVARRWRSQVNELAKAPAQFEEIPEADHNVVAGTGGPEALLGKTMAVFLRASLDRPSLTRRVEATRHVLMVEGFNTDLIDGEGENLLAQQWTCLHYGDYAAYYLAVAYGLDPTPIPAIESLKDDLRASGG